MDPLIEKKLRDEVIHLHSLWHQGPPTPNPIPPPPLFHFNPNPNPNPNPLPIFNPNPNLNPPIRIFNPNASHPNLNVNPRPYISTYLRQPKPRPHQFNTHSHLKPSNSTLFKKKSEENKNKDRWEQAIKDPDPNVTVSGWPTLNIKPAASKTRLATAEEQARIVGTRVQQNALKLSQEWFASNVDSDGEEEEEDDDECDDDLMIEDGYGEYDFFLNVFSKDRELRSYYTKYYERGEFSCLVCGGIGQKVGKRFKDLVALVQHSVTIAKTKKRKAHRSFGQAICKVLGWDIDKLPTINMPTTLGDSQGNALAEPDHCKENCNLVNVDNAESVLDKNDVNMPTTLGDSQGNALDGPDHCKESLNVSNLVNVDNGESVLGKNDITGEPSPDTVADSSNFVAAESMVCEGNALDGPDHCKESLNVPNLVNVDQGESVFGKNDITGEDLPDTVADSSNFVGAESMVCEHTLMVADANKNTDDSGNIIQSNAPGNEERVVNCLESYKEDGVGNAGQDVTDFTQTM